jgi:hypothetical protein
MLRTTNVDEISEIKLIPNLLNRRIKRECIIMRDKFDKIFVEYKPHGDIIVSFKKLNNEYIFIIPAQYPFIPPKIYINGMEQNRFFNLGSIRFKTILKYISGLECLCCNSLLFINNWSPTITMERVINEMEEYKKYKFLIIIKIILDKIKKKYLNKDIDLDSWLFNVYDPNLCYPGKSIH